MPPDPTPDATRRAPHRPVSAPDGPRADWWRRSAAVIVLAFLVCALVIAVLPLDRGATTSPPLRPLFFMAAGIALVTTTALFAVVRFELRLPTSIALLVTSFNALIVGVKFVAGPRAVYEANAKKVFEVDVSLNDRAGALLTAATVFLLYAFAMLLIYRHARRRTGMLERARRRMSTGALVVLLVLSVLFVGFGLTSLLLLVVLGALSGPDYVGYVFTSSGALLVAVALAIAATLANAAFRSTADRAKAIGDVGIVVALFWVCLSVLALYHVLWVVYILVLTSIWPLRVVTPK